MKAATPQVVNTRERIFNAPSSPPVTMAQHPEPLCKYRDVHLQRFLSQKKPNRSQVSHPREIPEHTFLHGRAQHTDPSGMCIWAGAVCSIFGATLECFQDHHDTTIALWVVNKSLPLLQPFLHCWLCIL